MPEREIKPFTPAQERLGNVVIRIISTLNVFVFRFSKGRLGGRFLRGAPVLLLTTIGRKSGQRRTAPLLYLADAERIVVVASKGGVSTHPRWYKNLESNPNVEVELKASKRR